MKKLFKKIIEADQHLIGINERNLEYVYKYNPRKYFPLANDKVLSKSILHENAVPTPETYAVVNELWEIEAILKDISSLNEIVIKPANGSGGGGILILFKREDKQWYTPSGEKYDDEKLKYHIASVLYGVYSIGDKDKAIIEYCLKPHIFLTNIYDKGIPDFRIIVLKGKPLMAMLRVPTKKSGGKANLHQGALGVGIDMEDGVLLNGFYKNKYTDKHPDSGYKFAGNEIPFWQKILAISIDTAKFFPLEYLGIDIILDALLGPVVIEINARPGLQIQNINSMGLKKAINQKFRDSND